jgi:hypothetical protein
MGGDMIQWEIAKMTKLPKFDNDPAKWEEFMSDWNIYWERMSQKGKHSEMTKLQLFEGCLPDEIKQEIKLLRMQGQLKGFTQLFAMLEARFGPDKRLGARKAWQEVSLPSYGKLSSKEWNDFWVNFRMGWARVPEATHDDAYRLLMNKVPMFLMNWIVEEQTLRSRRHPIVSFRMAPNSTETQVQKCIQVVMGIRVQKVVKKSDGLFWVHCDNRSDSEVMLTFHGRKIAEQPSAFHIEVVQQQMSLNDIFTFVEDRLKVRDTQTMVSCMRQDVPLPRQPRYVKTAEAKEEVPKDQQKGFGPRKGSNQRNQNNQRKGGGKDSGKGVRNHQQQPSNGESQGDQNANQQYRGGNRWTSQQHSQWVAGQICYSCGEKGHLARDCTNRNQGKGGRGSPSSNRSNSGVDVATSTNSQGGIPTNQG